MFFNMHGRELTIAYYGWEIINFVVIYGMGGI